MHIVLNDFKSFLGKKGQRFVVRLGERKEEFAVTDVGQILIGAASSISVGAIKIALRNEIDIVFLDRYGKPLGRIFPCKLGGTTLTRKKQAEAYYTEVGATIAKQLVKAKISNQAYFLKALNKSRKMNFIDIANNNLELSKRVDALDGTVEEIRQELFGIEGLTASGYFNCLKQILPFEKRDKDSDDKVNVFFNYGYGILYNEIEKACILAGLDPYFGFLHTDRYNKPSMVLDLIEEFRSPIVDRAVVTLFSQKQVKDELFETNEEEPGSLFLSKKGRTIIISAVMERLYTKISFKGRKTSFQDILLSQARDIANYLLDEKRGFEPFIYKW